jgi:hypothetical protein
MLKEFSMSVWSSVSETTSPSLRGRDGELVSVAVTAAPLDLEDLLEALAALDFPINPQIYHDAAVVYVEREGNERVEPATIVEFPAYAGRLAKIRDVLEASGFSGAAISVSPMLDEIRSGDHVEPAPPGAVYRYRFLRKRAAALAAG